MNLVSRRAANDVAPDRATGLYDVRRLADLLGVKPSTIRSMRKRKQLPEPTSADINGGAVWAQEIVDSFVAPAQVMPNLACEVNGDLPPVIDLFSGCGGMSLGFQLAGFRVLEGFDNWQAAVDTYSANLDHQATQLDLSDLDATIAELERFNEGGVFPAIIGGPPCQDFSSAGSRVEGKRADLTEKYAEIIAHFLPPFFVMENVARAQHASAVARAMDTMTKAGYVVDRVVLDASLCGVPQKRKRLFTFGARQTSVTEKIRQLLEENLASKPMTVRDWFGDRLGTETYYRHPRSYARRGVFSIDEPSPTIRGVNRPIPDGYPGHAGDAAPVSQTRPLTTQERAEIQTFPQGFEFVASRTDTEQMIGNAVPVRLAKYVGSAIAQAVIESR